jgi:hypothetical protein
MSGNREVQLTPYAKKALNEAQHQIDGLRNEIQEAERLKAGAEAELKPVQDATIPLRLAWTRIIAEAYLPLLLDKTRPTAEPRSYLRQFVSLCAVRGGV